MRALAGLSLALGLAACQSPDHYEWGAYQASVYNLTAAEGLVDVDAEIARITETVQLATEKGKPVPPGMHAHLGFLYSLAGDTDAATAAFETEMELYPESTTFLRGVLDRAQANR